MQDYELMAIISAESDQAQQDSFLKKIEELIIKAGGAVKETVKMGKRDLAYEIKKQSTGIYFLWNFSMEESAVKDFENRLHNDESLLRYLLLTKNF